MTLQNAASAAKSVTASICANLAIVQKKLVSATVNAATAAFAIYAHFAATIAITVAAVIRSASMTLIVAQISDLVYQISEVHCSADSQ